MCCFAKSPMIRILVASAAAALLVAGPAASGAQAAALRLDSLAASWSGGRGTPSCSVDRTGGPIISQSTGAEPCVWPRVVRGRESGQVSGARDAVMMLSGGNIDVNLLWRIMERCMSREGRLAYLRVRVPDRPGNLARLTEMLGARGANILQLTQRHGVGNLWVTEAEVDLTLETRGGGHLEEIKSALADAGYGIKDEHATDPWEHGGEAPR